MGLFKGSVSYRRFRLMGELPKDYSERFLGAVAKFAFKPIDGEPDADRGAGWVSIHDPLDTDFSDPERLYFDDRLLLALRVDRKRVPSKVLAAYLGKAEREYMEAQGRQELSRKERRNLKDMVRAQLLARVLPSMATYDVCLDLTEREVRFWALSKGICEEFMELFEETFGLGLLPMGAFGMASKVLDPTDLDKLDGLQPAIFVRGGRAQETEA